MVNFDSYRKKNTVTRETLLLRLLLFLLGPARRIDLEAMLFIDKCRCVYTYRMSYVVCVRVRMCHNKMQIAFDFDWHRQHWRRQHQYE